VWGIGTQLATAYDQPALGQVFKLNAIREPGSDWQYKVKLSETESKSSQPGLLQVRRFRNGRRFVADAIYDSPVPPGAGCTIVDPINASQRQVIPDATGYDDLLVPVVQSGRRVYDSPTLDDIRRRVGRQLAGFSRETLALRPTHPYPVGLEESLAELKRHLVREASRA